MKKMLSFALALVMLLAMFATAGATEGPAPEEAASSDAPAATEQPAPEVPAEPEAVQSGAQEPAADEEPGQQPPAETTQEPAAEATAEPSAEPSAEPTAEPAASEPAADEPVASEPAEAPADNIAAPASLPEVTDAPEATPTHRAVNLHANGGYFTGDHAGYDHFAKALVGDTLPKTGLDVPKSDPNWYTPARDGYRFLGWYEKKDVSSPVERQGLQEGDTVPQGVTDLFAGWMRVVVLDAEPGNFTDPIEGKGAVTQNYARTVDVPNDTMPDVSKYAPVFDPDHKESASVQFVGWYTEKSVVTTQSAEGYTTWSIAPKGQRIDTGNPLGAGITTLYAGYQSTAEAQKIVTYYYDWNGIGGKWGKSLTSSRAFEETAGGHTLTAEDLLVRYLNWGADGETEETKITDVQTQEDLENYWKGKTFNGYTFVGWATKPELTEPDVKAGQTVVKNGDSLYAVWKLGEGETETSNKTFVGGDGRVKNVGPLEFIQFLSLRTSVHGKKDAAVDLSMYTTPVDAAVSDVTWTVSYSVPNTKANSRFAPPEARVKTVRQEDGEVTVSADDGTEMFTLLADGARGLKITNKDGQDRALTISVSASSSEGTTVYSNTSAEVVFTHNWQPELSKQTIPATCSTNGEEYYVCTECREKKTVYTPMLVHIWDYVITTQPKCTTTGLRQDACLYCGISYMDYQIAMGNGTAKSAHQPEVVPATGHDYQVLSTSPSSVKGAPILKEKCLTCNETSEAVRGDINGDGELDVFDVLRLHESILGRVQVSDNVVGDTNGDNEVDVFDVLKLHEFILGRTTLN